MIVIYFLFYQNYLLLEEDSHGHSDEDLVVDHEKNQNIFDIFE